MTNAEGVQAKKELTIMLEDQGISVKGIRLYKYLVPELKISINYKDYLRVRGFNSWNGYKINFIF